MVQQTKRPPAPLAGPVGALGVLATLVVLFHGDGHDPTPALAVGFLTLAAATLRTRARRIVLFPLSCVVAFAVFSSRARVSLKDPGLMLTLVGIRLVEGACFAVLLLPLVLASLRSNNARTGSIVDRSQRRSPWAVAAGTAGLFGELSSAFFTGWILIADRGKPFRNSNWEQGVPLLYGIAAAGALLLVLADSREIALLCRAARWVRDGQAPTAKPSTVVDIGLGDDVVRIPAGLRERGGIEEAVTIRGSISRGLRSLVLSVGINLLALVFAVAIVWRRLLVSPE